MELNKETTGKIQDLQILERNLQVMAMEKQSSQVELNEIENALKELEKSSGDVYKITSGLMIKSDKNSLVKDLNEKKKVSELKILTIEENESSLEQKAEKLRLEIDDAISKKS